MATDIMLALSEAEIQGVIGAWPSDDAGLPASVQTAVDALTALTMGPINAAIRNLNDDPTSASYKRTVYFDT